MARIRYVAALSRDPDALASFYTGYLEMKELGRSAEGDVSLTDGLYNLTLFRKREGLGELSTRRGLHHIGLQVEDLGEARARYQKFNPRGLVVREPDDIHHGAIRIFDPECNAVTLSEGSFGVAEERGFPRIAHVAFNALDPEIMLNFYVQVLGLREVESSYVRRREGKLNRFCGDGSTNLAIHPVLQRHRGARAPLRRKSHGVPGERPGQDPGRPGRRGDRQGPAGQPPLRGVPLPGPRGQRPGPVPDQGLGSGRPTSGNGPPENNSVQILFT